jgi:hypothetical protein
MRQRIRRAREATGGLTTTTKWLCSEGGLWLEQWASCDSFLQWLIGDVTESPITVMTLSSNGLGWHHIFARCHYDHLIATTSDCGHHTSLLLLRAITVTIIWWYHMGLLLWRAIAASSWLVSPCSQKLGMTHISTCSQHNILWLWPRVLDLEILWVLMDAVVFIS